MLLPILGSDVFAQDALHRTIELRSEVFDNSRSIRVLLPPGYADSANSERRYPVFYFLDGIAAWDAWGVPDVVADLWLAGRIPEYIFVGIDNGGSTRESRNPVRDRASEYLPYADQTWTEEPRPEPRGDRFPSFLFDEVMPLIDRTFRTERDGSRTGLAGDSYAASEALYTALRFPDRVAYLLLESPSLHIGNEILLEEARVAERWPRAVYIGVGTAEGDTPDVQDRMVATVRDLYASVSSSPSGPRVLLTVRDGAHHWYDAWNERLPDALSFLLGHENGTGTRSTRDRARIR